MDWNRLYLEAVKQENDYRDAAFLELTGKICGLEVRPMTARDFLILDGIGSPFIAGGESFAFTRARIAEFLWHQNPKYGPGKLRAYLFGVHCWGLDFNTAMAGIRDYLSKTFQDGPGGSSRQIDASNTPYASWVAHLVDEVASEYGWPLERILNCPLRILYQQLRCIQKRKNPEKQFVNRRSRAVLGERLRLKQARLDLINLLAKRMRN